MRFTRSANGDGDCRPSEMEAAVPMAVTLV